MNKSGSFAAAASRRAPSLESMTEDRILNGVSPAEETPPAVQELDRVSGGEVDALDLLVARKPKRIQVTPLHCNIPVHYDQALRACMEEKGIEKTAIVVAGLKVMLGKYL